MSCLHVIWSWLREWLPYILPAVVNALLVVLGVVMSLPKLAEKIEDTPTYRKWLAGVCIVAGLVGFLFEVRARHDSDKTSTKLLEDVGTTLKKTNDLLEKTNALLTKSDTLATKSDLLAEQTTILARLNTGIEAAIEKHDPQKVRDLTAKAQAAQQQADRTGRELRALTLAAMQKASASVASSDVAPQLRNWENARVGDTAKAIAANLKEAAQSWRFNDYSAGMAALDNPCYGAGSTGPNGRDNCAKAKAQWVITEKELTARWQEKEKDLVNQANECRVEILTRLLPQQKGTQDDEAKLLYEKMVADSKNISPGSLDTAGSYLDNLWKRLPLF